MYICMYSIRFVMPHQSIVNQTKLDESKTRKGHRSTCKDDRRPVCPVMWSRGGEGHLLMIL